MKRSLRALWAAVACAAVGWLAPAAAVHAQDASALRQKAASLQPRFASNAFGRPLVLDSTQPSGGLRGDIYAVVEHPFATVQQALQSIDNWCDILILHLNVKRCKEVDRKLALDIGRKFDQPVEDAHRLTFGYRVTSTSPDYLQVLLTSEAGPFGTSDYRILVEAAPIEDRKALMHMSYSYAYGFAARMAIQTYLATLGKSKVGFTVVEKSAEGKPVHVGGVVGLLERNTMRYYLAIEAYLAAYSLPAGEQAERRIRSWYAGTERYAAQLHEMEQGQYLEMKRKEIRRQQAPA